MQDGPHAVRCAHHILRPGCGSGRIHSPGLSAGGHRHDVRETPQRDELPHVFVRLAGVRLMDGPQVGDAVVTGRPQHRQAVTVHLADILNNQHGCNLPQIRSPVKGIDFGDCTIGLWKRW